MRGPIVIDIYRSIVLLIVVISIAFDLMDKGHHECKHTPLTSSANEGIHLKKMTIDFINP